MDEGQLLLLWPGEVRRKREGDFGQIGPALLAGTNNRPSFINKIPSTSYSWTQVPLLVKSLNLCHRLILLVEKDDIISKSPPMFERCSIGTTRLEETIK